MYNPPVKGSFLKKSVKQVVKPDTIVLPSQLQDQALIGKTIYQLEALKEDVIKTVDSELERVDQAVTEANDLMVTAATAISDIKAEAIDIIKSIKPPEDGKDADEDLIIEKVLQRIPKPEDGKSPELYDIVKAVLAKMPAQEKAITEKELIKNIAKYIPKNKASLKVIQQTVETDPMSVIDKIMELQKKGKFKLGVEQIDGLEQTMAAFRSQLGKGYLHGGGTTVAVQSTPPPNPTEGQLWVDTS